MRTMPIHQRPASSRPAIDQVWAWLRQIGDPEIPVVSVVDLGIVREVAWSEDSGACRVTITPTYTGCPATAAIQSRIREELEKRGILRVDLRIRLSPPWTTDWLSPQARESLRAFGIAPPAGCAAEQIATILPVLASGIARAPVTCPHCGTNRTTPISQFGSTLCKALYRCLDCLEPFDYFKCH